VLDTVLGRGDGTPLKSSLVEEGIGDIFSLISLDEIAIHGLKYKDVNDNDTIKPLKLSDWMLLKKILHFVLNRDMEGNPINNMLTSITQEEFVTFRFSRAYISTRTPSSNSVPSTSRILTGNISSSNNNSSAYMFRRGIKREPTFIPYFER
jgi:hypothetical protein